MKNGVTKATTKQYGVYYASGVNMNYSFDSLIKIAEQHSAKLQEGDVIICDNANFTKRKALRKTKDGWAILYARIDEKETVFEPLKSTDGFVFNKNTSPRTGVEKPLIEYLL